MKKILFMLLVVAISARGQHAPGTKLYVHTESGLSLREKPNTASAVIAVVKGGESVEVLQDPNPPVAFVSTGVPGHWVRVNYQGKTGYQFDGFMSRYPPVKKFENNGGDVQGGILANYLKSIFKVKNEILQPPAAQKQDFQKWNEFAFDNGIRFKETTGTSYEISIVFPPTSMTYHEVFLVAREVWPNLFGDTCPYGATGMVCEGMAPQYLRLGFEKGNTTLDWYVSD